MNRETLKLQAIGSNNNPEVPVEVGEDTRVTHGSGPLP